MTHRLSYAIGCVLILALIATTGIPRVMAQKARDDTAVVTSVEGFVDVLYHGSSDWIPLKTGDVLHAGDQIETDAEGYVQILFAEDSILKIGPDSLVAIKSLGTVEVTKVHLSTFELIRGKIRTFVNPPSEGKAELIIETENASCGVRGTDFGESYDPDLSRTFIMTVSGCVEVSHRELVGMAPYKVCTGRSIFLRSGVVPSGPEDTEKGVAEDFLKDMQFDDGAGAGGDAEPPVVTSVFINRIINLDDIERTLTLTDDDMTRSGTVLITGTTNDEASPISGVEVSLDGGMTWEDTVGTESWSYEFQPREYIDYELTVRATNTAGVVSDYRDTGPWMITYTPLNYREVAERFLETLFRSVKNGNTYDAQDLISRDYDGSAGGYYSREELVRDSIDSYIDTGRNTLLSVTYSIKQVDSLGDDIIFTAHWTTNEAGTTNTGTTKWWLSKTDEYRLIHTEGDWFDTGYAEIEPDLEMYVDTIPAAPPCNKVVVVLMTVPDIPPSINSITVTISTDCDTFPRTLTRSYYQAKTGEEYGFGGEFVVEEVTSCLAVPFCAGSFRYRLSPDNWINVTYSDYGYFFDQEIGIFP
ncbi:MAG: FecR domain-containing protein [Deltaproteobacteria bacterium]|nr:FecR domain-containing protein [Candidatus Zymogenaceae bacterium]